MSSRKPSDSPRASADLDRIEEDIPTTPEDVEALRRVAESRRSAFTLEHVHLLAVPDWLPRPRRRKTSEGWEPFEL